MRAAKRQSHHGEGISSHPAVRSDALPAAGESQGQARYLRRAWSWERPSGGALRRKLMARTQAKIILSPSRDIPLDRLQLSHANVRRVKPGETIPELAEDIARRGLLQSLNVRPILDGADEETGTYEVPAGGRRFRALELLVKQKRLAKDAPIPCIVQPADRTILAEDDSLAENARREALHPLDQFRAMQAMTEKGEPVEDIAAHFFVTPAVVRQRLKLASVSSKLLDIYADDGMSLEILMAFTVKMEPVWGFNRAMARSTRRSASRASSAAWGSGPAMSSSSKL
jgi:ParB/RepB/Spo0J family partition protein